LKAPSITRWLGHPIIRCERRARRRELHASGPAETDRDLAAFDDDGDAAIAREADHPLELLLVLLDVDVGEGNLPLRVVLTGRDRVGSGVLAEDLDAVGTHRRLLSRRS
jgi:hypothetical protein